MGGADFEDFEVEEDFRVSWGVEVVGGCDGG